MRLKLYGYVEGAAIDEEAGPATLSAVTLVAAPSELRQIADFLTSTASEMERMGQTYSHEHLKDRNSLFEGSPDFVVCLPEGSSA